MRWSTAAGAVFGLSMAAGLAYCSYTESMVSHYATYADAERDGAIRRGWIPAYLPPSAREIHEVHDIESNRQWMRFRVPRQDAEGMVAGMRARPHDDLRDYDRRPPRWSGPWLPMADRAPQPGQRRASAYRDPRPGPGARCVDVEWGEPATVYAWSC